MSKRKSKSIVSENMVYQSYWTRVRITNSNPTAKDVIMASARMNMSQITLPLFISFT